MTKKTFCPMCANYLQNCICIGDSIETSPVSVVIYPEVRRYSKVTLVMKFSDNVSVTEIDSCLKELKKKFNTGGTRKKGQVELRTDMLKEVKAFLIGKGYVVKSN